MAEQMPANYRTNETWLVVLVFFVGFGVTIALLMLGGWNAFLVSRAETAIEFYTNQRDARELRRLGKVRDWLNGAPECVYRSPWSCVCSVC